MKHLILEDDELSFMVYYQPKHNAKLYELIFRSQQDYWKSQEKQVVSLLPYLLKQCQNNGFKVVDITENLKNKLNVYEDLEIDSFMYRGIKVVQSQYGFSFYLNASAKSFMSCLTIE